MFKHKMKDIIQILLEAHKLGVKKAIDDSARTGVPLVVFEGGKIKKIKAPYKYVRVPIQAKKKKPSSVLSRKRKAAK